MSGRIYNLRFDPNIEGVYIGRRGQGQEGYFGNPVILGARCPICHTIHKNDWKGRQEACACYQSHLDRRLIMDPEFARRFDALEGKNLICFCAPKGGLDENFGHGRICHGQVMLSTLVYRREWGLMDEVRK